MTRIQPGDLVVIGKPYTMGRGSAPGGRHYLDGREGVYTVGRRLPDGDLELWRGDVYRPTGWADVTIHEARVVATVCRECGFGLPDGPQHHRQSVCPEMPYPGTTGDDSD